MLISAELRWFWLGNCPSEVEQWFRSGEPPGGGDQAKPRVDRYFHHKGIVELGIKVRDERKNLPPDVEVKGLVTTRKAQGLGAARRPRRNLVQVEGAATYVSIGFHH